MDIITDEAAKIAASHFRDGYNYAESVLMGMQEYGTRKRGRISLQPLEQESRDWVCCAVTGGIIAFMVFRQTYEKFVLQ